MLNARSRSLLASLVIAPAISGCTTHDSQPIATGPWIEISSQAPVTPAISRPMQTVYLGAGDGFGPTLHKQYLASIEKTDAGVIQAVVSGERVDD